MRRWWLFFGAAVLVWGAGLASSCHMPRPMLAPDRTAVPVDSSTVYVVQHGWHAGIAIRRDHVPADRWPAWTGLPASRYLEIGWGEGGYYPNPDAGAWDALRAGLWPTGSVIHAVPVARSVRDRFPQQRMVRLRLSATELDRLASFIRQSVAVDSAGRAVPAAPGYWPSSRFYVSPLRYHVFQNCNHWAAEALEAAGCRTGRWRSLTVGQLMAQAERCGTHGATGPRPAADRVSQ
jgi:uncharacterized protein (TIGR02117 family)